jgi:hypothetical protein
MRQTLSQQNFQSFASVNSYENILNRYKTKKDLLAKTHFADKMTGAGCNKENMSTSPSTKGDGYLSFLEKQVDRANRAFQETAQQREQI